MNAAGAVAEWLAALPFRIGEIFGDRAPDDRFLLSHREDTERADLAIHTSAEDATEIARFDDSGKYRPLKSAPNLRHGWQLRVQTFADVRLALDLFYPGRLAAFAAWREERLLATPLRATLARQTGMYRITAKISDAEADELVARFCRSDGGCLRTICWRRDAAGTIASTLLPGTKYDPAFDQTGGGEEALPLLCQEACALLIAEARNVVKRRSEQPL